MTVETLSELIETQKLQTTTIKELIEICTILKDRVEALELHNKFSGDVESVKKYGIDLTNKDGTLK